MAHCDEHQRTAADVPPLVGMTRVRGLRGRWIALGVAAACLSLLCVAAWLSPDPRGIGTHRMMGLPPCSTAVVLGLPCPTCGMTTSFAWMMRGRPWRAFVAQPLGALLCLGVMAGAVLGLWAALTGMRPVVDWYRFSPAGLAIGIGMVFFLAWGAKIAIGVAQGTIPYP
ncbi:MAG: DUF2752 domain-containing protein [Phycisphaerae bacterium]